MDIEIRKEKCDTFNTVMVGDLYVRDKQLYLKIDLGCAVKLNDRLEGKRIKLDIIHVPDNAIITPLTRVIVLV